MRSGLSLIELMIALLCASLLMMSMYALSRAVQQTYRDSRSDWYCQQALRTAYLQLDLDLQQLGYLLPRELWIAVNEGGLFIGGLPRTSQHDGLQLETCTSLPCFALIREVYEGGLLLDQVSIDGDSRPDFWAGLGIITRGGAARIQGNYSRGNLLVAYSGTLSVQPADRVVPAIHYQLRSQGLYRNAQLLAENITVFEVQHIDDELKIRLEAESDDKRRALSFICPIL